MVERVQPDLESATKPDDQAAMLEMFAELKRQQEARADMPDDPRELAAWLARQWDPQESTHMIALPRPARTPPAPGQSRGEQTMIARVSFARLVSLHCHISGHEPEPRDLDEWLAAVWPMVEEQGMDPARWARAYMVACGLVSDQDDPKCRPGQLHPDVREGCPTDR
jgi:hypothetical protein